MRKLLLLPFLAAAAFSQGATLNLTGLAANSGTLNLNLVPPSGTVNGPYSAGPFNASLDGGASMEVYCGDLLHSANYSSQTATLVDTDTKGIGFQKAARILNRYYADADTVLERAALQGAIWRSIYGSDLTISDGTTGATALAESYLIQDLSAYSTHATYYDLGGNQSMLGISPVPEPASLAALSVGAMGLLRRRKR